MRALPRLLALVAGVALAVAVVPPARAGGAADVALARNRKAAEQAKKDGDAAAGDPARALAAYEHAMDIDPGYLPAYDAAAPLWFAGKKYDVAIVRLDAALKTDPGYAMGWYNLAFAHRKKGHNADAVFGYEKFIALRPGEPDAYYGLGLTYKAMGERDKARAALTKYIEVEKRADKQAFVDKARTELAELDKPAAPAPVASGPAAPAPVASGPAAEKPAAPAPVEKPAPVPEAKKPAEKPAAPAPVEKAAKKPAEPPLVPLPAPTVKKPPEATTPPAPVPVAKPSAPAEPPAPTTPPVQEKTIGWPSTAAPPPEAAPAPAPVAPAPGAVATAPAEPPKKKKPARPAAPETPRSRAEASKLAGDVRRDQADLAGAERSYRAAIAADPSWPEPYAGLGEVLLALHDRAGARTAFARYLELEKRPSEQATIARAKQQIAAIDGTATAATPAPAPPPPATPPAATPPLATTRPPAPTRTPGVITPLPAASPAQLAEARTWLGKGDTAFAGKHYDEAASDYRGAIAADPAGIDARYRLGVTLAAHGELSAAIAAWEGVLLLDASHEQARRNIELARHKQHASPAPVDDSAAMQQAHALVDAGRWASAVALLDGLCATPAHIQDPQAISLRAEARLGAGDAAGAIVDWLAVLALDPRFTRAYRGLADAYGLLGDAPRAAYFKNLAATLAP